MSRGQRAEPPARCNYCLVPLPDWRPPAKGDIAEPLVCARCTPRLEAEKKEMEAHIALYKRKAEEAKKK